MSSEYVRQTVRAYLQANWSMTRVIEAENLFNATEAAGDPLTEWTTVMFSRAFEEQASIGAPGDQRWREQGTVVLIAFVPSGSGTDRALAVAEALRGLFRGKQIDDSIGGETITFRNVDPPDTVLPSSVQASSGAWFGYSVDANYFVDFCGPH